MDAATLPWIEIDREKIAAACRANFVQSLDLFGSATTDRFDEARSDIDFLVQFNVPEEQSMLDPYFSLKQALEEIFHRPVDLIFDGAKKNPYFQAAVDRQRHPLYP